MLFQLGSLLGIILGYLLCIGQAKLTLWIYARTAEGRAEEADRLHAEWVAHHHPEPQSTVPVQPSSVAGDGRTLAEQWNLPRNRETACEGLLKTKRAPEGWTASMVLGYNDFGIIHPPKFPNGIHGWDKEHGITVPEDEE